MAALCIQRMGFIRLVKPSFYFIFPLNSQKEFRRLCFSFSFSY